MPITPEKNDFKVIAACIMASPNRTKKSVSVLAIRLSSF